MRGAGIEEAVQNSSLMPPDEGAASTVAEDSSCPPNEVEYIYKFAG